MNYVLVPDEQPRCRSFFDYPDESDLDGGTFPYGFIPSPRTCRWKPGRRKRATHLAAMAAGREQHGRRPAFDHRETGRRSDLGNVAGAAVGSDWEASNGAKFNLNTNALRPAGWTSGDAAGLPMFPALVRYDECERGMVEHAMRIVVKHALIHLPRHALRFLDAATARIARHGPAVRLKAGFIIPANWTIQEKAVLLGVEKIRRARGRQRQFLLHLGHTGRPIRQ